MNTYCPTLTECYACYESFEKGDRVVTFFEHYLHVSCAPVHIIEQGITFVHLGSLPVASRP